MDGIRFYQCTVKSSTRAVVYINNNLKFVEIFSSSFNDCVAYDSGCVLYANNCKNVSLSKVCSSICTSQSNGQFCHVNLDKLNYNFQGNQISVVNAKSSGNFGFSMICSTFYLSNTNCSYLDYGSIVFSDETGYGCSYEYLIVDHNKGRSNTIMTEQEIKYSGINSLKCVNYINNYYESTDHGQILFVGGNAIVGMMNALNNSGNAYLFSIRGSIKIDFQYCHVQETYGSSRVFDISTVVVSVPENVLIISNVHGPECENVILLKYQYFGFSHSSQIFLNNQSIFAFLLLN